MAIGSNNSLNIQQDNGEILIGSTGNAPVSTLITGSNGITVTNGAGTIDISKPLNLFNFVPISSGTPLTMQRDSIYYVTSNVLQTLYFPTPTTVGSMFYVLCVCSGGVSGGGVSLEPQPSTTQQVFYTTAVSSPGIRFNVLPASTGVASILLTCTDASPGAESFQVIGTPIGFFEGI